MHRQQQSSTTATEIDPCTKRYVLLTTLTRDEQPNLLPASHEHTYFGKIKSEREAAKNALLDMHPV